MLLYVLENFIDEDTILSYNSEDTLYVVENIYNERPSLPYRTTGKGAIGAPEFICMEFLEPKVPTFAGLFNHNISNLIADGDELRLKACVDPCAGSGACDWDSPDCEIDLTSLICPGTQPIANFKNTYSRFSCGLYQYWRLDAIDQLNPDGFLEIGELVLGRWHSFHRGALVYGDPNWVRLSPGREDGPWFFTGEQRTHYGQDWYNYFSSCEKFSLTFTNLSDPCIVDEVHAFLKKVMEVNGKFILIPDDSKPFCYLVKIENLENYARRLIYGCERELREWKLELKTMVEGIRLI